MMTTYELTWGCNGKPTQTRYFDQFEQCDAVVRLSERVLEMDRDPEIYAAYASLKRLPDSIYPEGECLVAWTKTSDERPTAEGATEIPAQAV
jgi:hypothetical protein